MKSWYAISPRAESNQTEISIFDEIGYYGVSAKQFVDDLKTVPAGNSILLKIHSPGGEVFDGNVIYNALKRHAGGVVVQIEGLCASMASVIALAGAPVRMAANGFFMIHNPWGMAVGDAAEMRDQASLLEKIKQNMVSAYAAKCKKAEVMIEEWMDAETWFTAQQAKDVGFVDEITDAMPIAASANKFSRIAKFRNAPANLTAPQIQMANEPAPATEPEPLPAAPTPEPAPEPTPEPAPEPTPAPAPEPDPIPAPSASVEPSALLAKVNSLVAERDSFKALADQATAELTTARELCANLERSLGLSAARVIPEINPDGSNSPSDPVSEYLAAVEAGDRKLAQQLFEKHKAAIWQHRRTISKG